MSRSILESVLNKTRLQHSQGGIAANRVFLDCAAELINSASHNVCFITGAHVYDSLDEVAKWEGESLDELTIFGRKSKDSVIGHYVGEFVLKLELRSSRAELEWMKDGNDPPPEFNMVRDLLQKQPAKKSDNWDFIGILSFFAFLYALTAVLGILAAGWHVQLWLWILYGVFFALFQLGLFLSMRSSKPISLLPKGNLKTFWHANRTKILMLIIGAAAGGFFAAFFTALFNRS